MTTLLTSAKCTVCACCTSEFPISVSENFDPGSPPPPGKNKEGPEKGSSRRRGSLGDFEGRSLTDSEEDTLYGSEIKIEVDVDPVSFPQDQDESGEGADDTVEDLGEAEGQLINHIESENVNPTSTTGASKQQQRLPSFSKEKIPAILSLLFEYPWILREEETVFKCSSAEVDIIFCDKCETALFNLYSMFRRFIKLLKNDGKVWNLLRRVGCSGDDKDTQALIRRLGLGKYRRRASGKRKKQSRRGKQTSTITPKKVKGDEKRKEKAVAAGSAKATLGASSSDGVTKGKLTERQKKLTAGQEIPVIDVEELEEQAKSAGNDTGGLSGSEVENLDDGEEDFDPCDDSDDPTFRVKKRKSRSRHENRSEGKRRGRPPAAEPKPHRKTPVSPDDDPDESTNSDATPNTKPPKKKRIRIRKKEFWEEEAKKDPSRTCDVCGKPFLYASMMRHHKLTVHEGKKPFECEHCGKGFTQKLILKKHTCDYSLAGPDKEFLRIAREEQLFRWTCEVCGKRFKLRSTLFVHQKNHGEEAHKCDKCDKIFKRKDHLKAHIRLVHNTGKRFVCTICGQGFKTSSYLKEHENKHTNPDQKHLCSICGKSIKTLSQMGRHQKTHEDVLPFECHICGKRFKMKDYLGQHLRKGKTCGSKAITQSQSQQAESSSSINRDNHSGTSPEATTTELRPGQTFQPQQQVHAQSQYQRPGPSYHNSGEMAQFSFP